MRVLCVYRKDLKDDFWKEICCSVKDGSFFVGELFILGYFIFF